VIRSWWAGSTEWNVGAVTGDTFLVLDVDGELGAETLTKLQGGYLGEGLPSTLGYETGRGRHLWFRTPGGVQVRTSLGHGANSLLPGIDVKSSGGYVVVPPSKHVSGRRYGPIFGASIAPLPQELLELLAGPTASTRTAAAHRGSHDDYVIGEGQRNNTLMSLAGRMRSWGMSERAITVALLEENASRCDPPLDDNEVCKIASSAGAYAPGRPDTGSSKPDQDRRPITLARASDLLYRPAPSWLVEGVLPEQGLFTLFGQSGVGKSFVALDLALSVANGIEWLGQRTRRGAVVYVAQEGGWDLGGRIDAWIQCHSGCSTEGLFIVEEQAVDLLNPADIDMLCTAICAIAPAHALSIFDTLALSVPGGDENSTKDMGAAVAGVRAIATATSGLVGLVAHTGWTERSRERGSSAIRGAMDTTIRCEAGVLSCIKQRGGPPFSPIGWQLTPAGSSAVAEAASLVSVAANRMLSLDERIMALVARNPSSNRSEIYNEIRGNKGACNAAIDGLVAAGKLVERRVGHARLYDLADQSVVQ
jgi:hypothetical protein